MSEVDLQHSSVKRKYNDLSLDLNLDQVTADEAWTNYENIQLKYTLEVRKRRVWLVHLFHCHSGYQVFKAPDLTKLIKTAVDLVLISFGEHFVYICFAASDFKTLAEVDQTVA